MLKNMILGLIVFSLSQTLLANDIQGQFIQPCQTIDDDTIQQSLIFSQDYKNQKTQPKLTAQLTWEISAFEDEKCQIPYLKISRQFDIIAKSSSSVTVKTIQVTYLAISDEIAESLNYINYCGYTDWTAGEPKDVTGRVCDDYQQLKIDELKQYSLMAQPSEPIREINWDNDKTPYIRSEVSKNETVQ